MWALGAAGLCPYGLNYFKMDGKCGEFWLVAGHDAMSVSQLAAKCGEHRCRRVVWEPWAMILRHSCNLAVSGIQAEHSFCLLAAGLEIAGDTTTTEPFTRPGGYQQVSVAPIIHHHQNRSAGCSQRARGALAVPDAC